MKFNSETGKIGGQNSKRGKDSNAELIRKAITGKFDIAEMMDEISQMELEDRVAAKIKLLNFILPKLQSVDVSIQDLSIVEWLKMKPAEQDAYLNSLQN